MMAIKEGLYYELQDVYTLKKQILCFLDKPFAQETIMTLLAGLALSLVKLIKITFESVSLRDNVEFSD
jgi:hypothetical protein